MDGKRHYGDGVYDEWSKIFGYDYNTLARAFRMSVSFEISRHRLNVHYNKHFEIISLKTITETEDGKLMLSKETDYEKITELLERVEKALGMEEQTLRQFKMMSEKMLLLVRTNNLKWPA